MTCPGYSRKDTKRGVQPGKYNKRTYLEWQFVFV